MRSIQQCYEILGVVPGATQAQIKQAYHDLVKVWHPDRFSHDARLQVRAQEKLKEINEAHDRLTSGGASFRPETPRRSSAQPTSPARYQEKGPNKLWLTEQWTSFITLVIAIAVVGLIFYLFWEAL